MKKLTKLKALMLSLTMLAAMTIIFFIPSVLFLIFSTMVMGTDKVNNQKV